MSLFKKKEEKVHFVRDEAGNVTKVEREYNGRSKTPVSDKLLSQVRVDKRKEREIWKEQKRDAYDKAFRKARLERIGKQGRMAGRTTFSDRLEGFASGYTVRNNYNPFGDMFDTGMKVPKRKKSKGSSKKKYTVIGGKAYPVVGTGQKKKKTKKKRTSNVGYNMFDNWGYMK